VPIFDLEETTMPIRSTALAMATLAALTAAPVAAEAPQAPTAPQIARPDDPAGHEHHSRHRHGMRPGTRGARWVGPVTLALQHRQELGLTSEQVERLERLRLDATRELIRRGADLRVAELELRALRRSEPVDLTPVEQKLREIERLRTDLRLQTIRAVEGAKAQLTPDQRTKLRTLFEERLRHHRPRGTATPTSA